MATKPMQHAIMGAPKRFRTRQECRWVRDAEEWVTAGFGNSAYKVSGPQAKRQRA